jgi:hypothetical protein
LAASVEKFMPKASRKKFRIAALLLLGVLFATNIYRAATQSIVHDEALTWQIYLAGPASAMFHFYDANHHFLATVLFRISTTLFGDSEFAMRLPTLLAGAWFFWTVFQLCGLVFGDGWLFLLACAALTMNPILLDFLVAARGYGLAMAGLFWALFQMLAWFHDRSPGIVQGAGPRAIARVSDAQLRHRLWNAALGCAVAVAANLTLLMPVFVLAVAFCVILRAPEKPATGTAPVPPSPSKTRKKKRRAETARGATRSYAHLIHFVVPIIVLATIFLLAAPIDVARSQDFYVGTPTALRSLRNLMNASFAYGNGSSAMHSIEQVWSNIAMILLPAMALAALIVVAITGRQPSTAQLATWLASLPVVGSAVLLIGAHLLAGIPYPIDRTGIYFVPLASLAALGLARILMDRSGPPRWVSLAVVAVVVSFTVEFAAQWNVNSFLVWRYDADTKRIFEALEAAPKPAGPIRLGVSWTLEPGLNYYREVRKASWLMPVFRDGFDGPRQFYVATTEDQSTAPWPKLKQIYTGRISGTALAIPPAPK